MTRSSRSDAFKAFQIENDIHQLSYNFHDPKFDVDVEELYEKRPWRETPKYFKRV